MFVIFPLNWHSESLADLSISGLGQLLLRPMNSMSKSPLLLLFCYEISFLTSISVVQNVIMVYRL